MREAFNTIQAIREGAADYIMKSIDKEEFSKMLQRLTRKRLDTLEQRRQVRRTAAPALPDVLVVRATDAK